MRLLKSPALVIVSWFGSGLSPIIPGTMGTLATLPFAWIVQYYYGSVGLLIGACLLFVIGCLASDRYLRTNPDKKDPGEIVIDETAAMFLTLTVFAHTWLAYLMAFLAFRAADILKPWPASWADRKVKGAIGVMLDDILAALIVIYLIIAALFITQYIPAMHPVTRLLIQITEIPNSQTICYVPTLTHQPI